MLHRMWLIGVLIIGTVGLGGAARAGEVTIHYDHADQAATAFSGTMTLKFQGTDINTLVPGPMVLSTLEMGGGGSNSGVAIAFRTGLRSPINGTFNGTFAFGTQTATNDWTQTIFGTSPLTFTGSRVFLPDSSPGFPPDRGFFASAGGGGGLVTVDPYAYNGYAGLVFSGQETSRTFVPEPGAPWLLGSGVFALAALNRWRQRSVAQEP